MCNVKKCVMISKTCHDVKKTSCSYKVRNDVKNIFDLAVTKFVMVSKIGHDLKTFVMKANKFVMKLENNIMPL